MLTPAGQHSRIKSRASQRDALVAVRHCFGPPLLAPKSVVFMGNRNRHLQSLKELARGLILYYHPEWDMIYFTHLKTILWIHNILRHVELFTNITSFPISWHINPGRHALSFPNTRSRQIKVCSCFKTAHLASSIDEMCQVWLHVTSHFPAKTSQPNQWFLFHTNCACLYWKNMCALTVCGFQE